MTKAKKKKTSTKTDAPKRKAKPKVEKTAPVKRRRLWLSVMVAAKDISKPALKLIKEADSLEVQIADATEALQDKLREITEALGGASFEHPERGPMTIMSRNDKTFWRAKPAGVSQA